MLLTWILSDNDNRVCESIKNKSDKIFYLIKLNVMENIFIKAELNYKFH